MKSAKEWNEEFPQNIHNPMMDMDIKKDFLARYVEHLRQIQLDALKEGMRRAAAILVKQYPIDVQGDVMQSGFSRGCFEKRQSILTALEQLTLKDI